LFTYNLVFLYEVNKEKIYFLSISGNRWLILKGIIK
jgi:hypothetical protein